MRSVPDPHICCDKNTQLSKVKNKIGYNDKVYSVINIIIHFIVISANTTLQLLTLYNEPAGAP